MVNSNNPALPDLPPLTAYAAMTLAELLHTGSVAADLRARDVITQADFLHRSDIVIAALMVVRLDAELKAARERLATLLAEHVTPPATTAESVTVERAHVEGRYPYRWQEEGGKWHTVTNIVNDGTTDEYEIWFEAIDPAAWAVVRRTEKLLRGGAL